MAGDRLKELQKIRDKHDEKDHKLVLYKALTRHILEKVEYRLPLWLPLTLEEKLDMLIHQRVEDEAEIMVFLIEEEYNLSQNY